jgi:ABC-type bacteriocin/lantibiotic exporter with double-glycine peptidase domain
MLLFLALYQYFISPLDTFLNLIIKYPLIKKEFNMIEYILNLPCENKSKSKIKIDTIKNVEFSNYKFGYEKNKSIFKINLLRIKNNTKIIGQNGIGKSTFLKVLAGYYKGTGQLRINGLSISNYNIDHYRNQVIYLSSSDYLPSLSILEYITNGSNEQYKIFMSNMEKFKLNKILKMTNIKLEDNIINNGDNLSNGQKQIIKIMTLFCQKYKLIILDEVFDHLNSEVFNLIKIALFKFHNNVLFIEAAHNRSLLSSSEEVDFAKFN